MKRDATAHRPRFSILVPECGLRVRVLAIPTALDNHSWISLSSPKRDTIGWSPGWIGLILADFGFDCCGLFSYSHTSLVADTMHEAVGGQGRIITDGQEREEIDTHTRSSKAR